MRRRAVFFVLAAVVVGLLPLAPAGAASAAGSYIVVLDSGDPGRVAADHSRRHGASVKHVYRHALRGYAARMSAQAAARIARNPRVAYVEPDGVVTASETQSNPTWGLDRIDQRSLPLSTSYTYSATGAGVTAYVIDTGIRRSHDDFSGRATGGYDVFGGNGNDCNGHGTHVAGTIGGTTYGVAKGVTLVPVRVLDCNGSGTWSGVIAGVDWVRANATKPAVANMSLGGGASSAVDTAVDNLIKSGVPVAVAAGNGNRGGKEQDACGYSPARVPAAITIGATNSSDVKASWSNYGDCVDFFAPGVSITSAWIDSDRDTNTISGTSMAAPHVAGAAALYLEDSPGASPAVVRDDLYAATTKNKVTSSNTVNNHLLYTGSDASTQPIEEDPPANAAPTASFTSRCTDLACDFTDASTDADGSVNAWSWDFGDGGSSTLQSPSHTYESGGTYTVTLRVTDDDGATDSFAGEVTVAAASGGGDLSGITLSVTPYKLKGWQYVDLSWSGATSTSVDVYRDGVKRTTTANGGAYTDEPGVKGGGMFYVYKVCEAGTSTCSNEATAVF